MGKESQYPSGQDEAQAHNISSRQKENRGRSACALGEAEGAAEEACLAARGESALRIRARLQACHKCCVMKAPSGAGAGDWTFTTDCFGPASPFSSRKETEDSILWRWLYHLGFDNELVGRFPDEADLACSFAGRALSNA